MFKIFEVNFLKTRYFGMARFTPSDSRTVVIEGMHASSDRYFENYFTYSQRLV